MAADPSKAARAGAATQPAAARPAATGCRGAAPGALGKQNRAMQVARTGRAAHLARSPGGALRSAPVPGRGGGPGLRVLFRQGGRSSGWGTGAGASATYGWPGSGGPANLAPEVPNRGRVTWPAVPAGAALTLRVTVVSGTILWTQFPAGGRNPTFIVAISRRRIQQARRTRAGHAPSYWKKPAEWRCARTTCRRPRPGRGAASVSTRRERRQQRALLHPWAERPLRGQAPRVLGPRPPVGGRAIADGRSRACPGGGPVCKEPGIPRWQVRGQRRRGSNQCRARRAPRGRRRRATAA